MAYVDGEKRRILATLCYVGRPGSGKFANLAFLDAQANPDQSRLVVGHWLDHARTMSHTVLELDSIHGYKVELALYAIHQIPDEHPVLAAADAIVIVVDSTATDNEATLAALRPAFGARPIIVQFNKRDLPGARPILELAQELGLEAAPSIEAAARQGVGVFETLKLATRLALTPVFNSAEPPRTSPP